MRHIFWILPEWVAGRCGPQREPWDLADLHCGGFRAICSLDEKGVDVEAIEEIGFEHCFALMPEGVPAKPPRNYQQGLKAALEFIGWQLEAQQPVLVHCDAGKDRTGLLAVALLAPRYRGRTIQELRKVKPRLLTGAGFETVASQILRSK